MFDMDNKSSNPIIPELKAEESNENKFNIQLDINKDIQNKKSMKKDASSSSVNQKMTQRSNKKSQSSGIGFESNRLSTFTLKPPPKPTPSQKVIIEKPKPDYETNIDMYVKKIIKSEEDKNEVKDKSNINDAIARRKKSSFFRS